MQNLSDNNRTVYTDILPRTELKRRDDETRTFMLAHENDACFKEAQDTLNHAFAKRSRQKASQTVRVDHMHVNEGGQAIVGDVHHTGGSRGVDTKTKEQPHGPRLVSHESRTPMRCQESTREAVPVSRNAR